MYNYSSYIIDININFITLQHRLLQVKEPESARFGATFTTKEKLKQ